MKRFFLVVIVLLVCHSSIFALKVTGYIIKNASDTIFGEISVLRYDIISNEFYTHELNTEPLHTLVYFRENTKKHFKQYTPKEISGFGFNYKLWNYQFKSFTIKTKSIVASERHRNRFLLLIQQGEIEIYKDILRNERYLMSNYQNKIMNLYDYYLYNNKYGLKKAVSTNEYKSPVELLNYYGINKKFLSQLPKRVQFKDVKEILFKYELWKIRFSDTYKKDLTI